MNVFYRANGATSSDAGSYSLTGTTPVGLATTSITANFIKTATSTMEIGAVYASGTKGVRLSRIVAYITYTPLAAPTGLSATATTSSQVLLNWTDNSTFESGYSVERSTDGVNYGAIASTSAFATSGSYYDKTVAASTLYLYRVRAFDAGGYSAYSNIAYASTTGSVPNAPSNLTASASGTTVTLNWFDNSSNETAFELLRSTDGSTFLHLASTTASTTAYNDTGVAPGTYWYRVRAANSSGYSSTTNTATATVSLSLPLDPTGLVASSTTFGTTSVASLQWTDNATNESSYTVERGPSPLSFDTTFSGLAVDTHVFQDYSVASGQTYFYRVYASNTSGNSGYSNIATTTVP
jgi:titin